MSVLSDALRPFWLPGIQTVVGRPIKGFHGFVLDEQYQIYALPTSKSVELSYAEPSRVLSALAFDITRFSTAALESIADSRPDGAFPKSTAWLMIRSYYAAFFAAHSIARMLGVSFTRFESIHCNSIFKIAKVFMARDGDPPIIKLSNGLYRCAIDSVSNTIKCDLLGDSGGGSHEVFWASFGSLMKEISAAVLVSAAGVPANNLTASQSIDSLCQILNLAGRNGAWLSKVRNSINYQQAMGCWYPYRDAEEKSQHTLTRAQKWRDGVDTIKLTSGGEELHRFQTASLYLISLCREMAIDMSERSPRGKSFHAVGILAMLKLLEPAKNG